MKTIYRAPIQTIDLQTITAPGLGHVLSVEDRRGLPEVWFTVDDDQPPRSVRLWVVGTGNPIPDHCLEHGYYVGHFLSVEGAFVGHVYASPYDEGES